MTTALGEALTVARYAMGESVRRRVFHAAILLAALFVALYWIGASMLFAQELQAPGAHGQVDPQVAPTVFGLALFGIHFLGLALAVFLTMSTVQGDAERGLLQQVLVRPLSAATYLSGRLAAAIVLSCSYVVATFASTLVVTRVVADWTPGHAVPALLLLCASTITMCLLGVFGSIYLSAAANGILLFMTIGLGMLGGLLGQIGDGVGSRDVSRLGDLVTRAVPSEALYQGALHEISTDVVGLGGFVLRLGPFGGSQKPTVGLLAWCIAYALVVFALSAWSVRRRDL